MSDPTVTWWGRWPNVNFAGGYRWHQEEIPVGETPWTWDEMPWTPIDIWLPHPPVRKRKKKKKGA